MRPTAGPRESQHSGYVDNDGYHGNVGSRALAYYKYRSTRDSVSLTDRNTLRSSVSTRLVQASDSNVSHRTVVDYNNITSVRDEFNDRMCDRDGALGDDEWDDDDVGHVTQSNEDSDVTVLMHKVKQVTLGDDKRRFWSEFYKSRQAKRADTKDCDVTARSSCKFTEEAQLAGSHSCTRSVVEAKETPVERDPLGDNVHSEDLVNCSEVVNDNLGALRQPRNVSTDGDSVRDNDKENIVNANRNILSRKLAAYHASRFRDQPVIPNRDLWSLERNDAATEADSKDYIFNNYNEGAERKPSVKNSLLLRRLHIYEQINSKMK
ncbi:hypothetical protein B5X24_HaOG215761 [Helicoverpa armigera]|uniref:Uncharacterized protein n=1 Tax=Helicoverpa armigera TaxID=29058 RepID=A0A2W1B2L7_HELAM|nr:hypothetical protein B5X24_HaOG215761 [Helicoverpa armigera]